MEEARKRSKLFGASRFEASNDDLIELRQATKRTRFHTK